MGKRIEWSDELIKEYVRAADGSLTDAAKAMRKDFPEKSVVTRQNLAYWLNDVDAPMEQDSADRVELSRKLRLQMNNNNTLRRNERAMLDAMNAQEAALETIKRAVSGAVFAPPTPKPTQNPNGRKLTIELLFSDLQIGKLMDDYDSQVAARRVDEWTTVAIDRIHQYETLGYKIERIVLAVLGDIIESDKKHDNSGRACDIGTAQQIELAIDWMFNRVLLPLSSVDAPIDVVMITGNHDWDGHGLTMFKPGREQLSWPMYHAVRMLSEAAKLNATFDIPEGSFTTADIYGQTILYEHGVGVAASAAAMKKHVANRTDQLKQYISLFRMGDKHNICRFNNDRFVVNGAFFGDSRSGEEYSGIAGYDGEPAQLMFAHVQRADNQRTSLFDSLAIQLGHVK